MDRQETTLPIPVIVIVAGVIVAVFGYLGYEYY